jgi:hypothetical protein
MQVSATLQQSMETTLHLPMLVMLLSLGSAVQVAAMTLIIQGPTVAIPGVDLVKSMQCVQEQKPRATEQPRLMGRRAWQI